MADYEVGKERLTPTPQRTTLFSLKWIQALAMAEPILLS
jgi:hypothetical protein